MAAENWTLPAQVVKVVDGDTLELNYNLGFNLRRTSRARLLGINTAETFGVDPRTAAAVEGRQQAEFTKEWVGQGLLGFVGQWPFLVTCHGFDKYGRDLVVVERRNDGKVLSYSLAETFPSVRRG